MTAMGAVASVTAGGWPAAWSDALGELELSIEQAESQLASIRAHGAGAPLVHLLPWQPRHGLGPLPAPLRARAQALLDRQLDTARRVAEAANLSRRQAQAAEGMRTRPPALPVYLDTEG